MPGFVFVSNAVARAGGGDAAVQIGNDSVGVGPFDQSAVNSAVKYFVHCTQVFANLVGFADDVVEEADGLGLGQRQSDGWSRRELGRSGPSGRVRCSNRDGFHGQSKCSRYRAVRCKLRPSDAASVATKIRTSAAGIIESGP